ncbi:choice-of-anchor B family protein [Alteromonas sediminis]|nr:choice-of-anchor B family protein [Alteromonas sediminis]
MNGSTAKLKGLGWATLVAAFGHFCMNYAFAHSEHDKGRFVSSQGVDTGLCDNRFRPCRSIAYAAAQANKGDVVLVASGQYMLQESDIAYIANNRVPVRGGYTTQDHFTTQHPSLNETLLLGLPEQHHDHVYQNGFTVLHDGKGQRIPQLTAAQKPTMAFGKTSKANTCSNPRLGDLECEGISLVGHLYPAELRAGAAEANDIWGHIDLNTGKEYAIVGLSNGVSVVDISDPEAPRVVGSLAGQVTTWRDIKVYQEYRPALARWQAWAYVTADGASDGLLVVDLNNLENGISVATRDMTDPRAHNVYISGVDYSLNIANTDIAPQIHVMGANNFGGALRSYNLLDPSSPQPSYVPSNLNRSDYAHDASSMLVQDERAERDCPNVQNGQCIVLIDFNENALRLWDNTTLTSAAELSQTPYPNAEYAHSGWWSEDRRYVFLHDELDESRLGLNTTINIFDVSELTAPQLVSTWTGPTRAIDHNGFVRGSRYYMSNYERGLTILDISDPLNVTEAGFFDSYPLANGSAFNGAWGVYPFLPSGLVLVSDIQSGLLILRDNTLAEQANVGFAQSHIEVREGETSTISVVKQGTDAMTVNYTMVYGSADRIDAEELKGELRWEAGDETERTLSLTINSDDVSEPEELLFIRLHTPQGGFLSPQERMIQVSIAGDTSAQGQAVFANATLRVLENQQTATIELVRSGGDTGELRVPLSFVQDDASSDLTLSEQEVVWRDGESQTQSIQVTIVDDNLTEETEVFTLMAGASSIAISVADDESNLPPTVNAGDDMSVNARATVELRGSASDPESNALTVSWTQTDGPSVTLNDPSADTTQFTAPNQQASLTFSFTATDEFGVQVADTVTVSVAAPVTAPPPPQAPSSSGGGPLNLLMLLYVGLLALSRSAYRYN